MSEPSLGYFVAIAEECNISKAAKRLNMSQQGLSNYLQKLEEYYGTPLLVRKPSMHLTEAGAMVYDAARQVHQIKHSLYQNIERLNVAKNSISIGIYAPNAALLMDFIPLVEFGKKYPNVTYNVTEDSNHVLRKLLGDGELDLVVGAYRETMQFPDFEIKKLYTNQEYVIISDVLMKQYFPDVDEQMLKEFQNGVQLKMFQDVPLVLPSAECGFTIHLNHYCEENNLKLNVIGEISNRYLSNSMVYDGVVYGFCDKRYLSYLFNTRPQPALHKIYAFPIKGPTINNNVGVLYRKAEKHPAYFLELIDMILKKNKDLSEDNKAIAKS